MTDIADVFRKAREEAEADHALISQLSNALRFGLPLPASSVAMADMLDRLREEHLDHLVKRGPSV